MLGTFVTLSTLGLVAAGGHEMSCMQQDMDVGGGTNSCGYMNTLVIFAPHGAAKYDWYTGYFKNVAAETIDSAEKCMAMCEAWPGCAYFAWSAPDPFASPLGDCSLKPGYAEKNCTPLYEPYNGSIAGPKQCESCFMEEMDVGGSFNACGFMENVAIYAKPGVAKQSWYEGHYVELHDVATWTVGRCQQLCAANPECDYFHMSEDHCYLKADYSHELHEQHAATGGCVPLYNAFDVERTFKYVSGPSTCMHVQEVVSCGSLRQHYKDHMCCGAPSKIVAMP